MAIVGRDFSSEELPRHVPVLRLHPGEPDRRGDEAGRERPPSTGLGSRREALSDETLALRPAGHDRPSRSWTLLYRKESADGDGLAVVNLDTQGRYGPDASLELRGCRPLLRGTARRCAPLCPSRTGASTTTSSAARPSPSSPGGETAFRSSSRSADFLHVPAEPAPEPGTRGAASRNGRACSTRMGYTGDLRAQCAAWEERNRVPPEQVPAVLEGLLDEAWRRTEERVAQDPEAAVRRHARGPGERASPSTRAATI